jgi:hypothetical protein
MRRKPGKPIIKEDVVVRISLTACNFPVSTTDFFQEYRFVFSDKIINKREL